MKDQTDTCDLVRIKVDQTAKIMFILYVALFLTEDPYY